MINKRKLGKTDLLVSEIGLGGYQLGGFSKINEIPISFGDMDEKTAINIINTAMELGINTFDTADFYSLGKSEIRLGKAVKEYRDKVNLFTKAGSVASYTDIAFDVADNEYSLSEPSSVSPVVFLIVADNNVPGGCNAPTTGWITSYNIFLVAVTLLRPAHSPDDEAVSEFCAVIV